MSTGSGARVEDDIQSPERPTAGVVNNHLPLNKSREVDWVTRSSAYYVTLGEHRSPYWRKWWRALSSLYGAQCKTP